MHTVHILVKVQIELLRLCCEFLQQFTRCPQSLQCSVALSILLQRASSSLLQHLLRLFHSLHLRKVHDAAHIAPVRLLRFFHFRFTHLLARQIILLHLLRGSTRSQRSEASQDLQRLRCDFPVFRGNSELNHRLHGLCAVLPDLQQPLRDRERGLQRVLDGSQLEMRRSGRGNLEAVDVGVLGVGLRFSLLRSDDGRELLQVGLLVDGSRGEERRKGTGWRAGWRI